MAIILYLWCGAGNRCAEDAKPNLFIYSFSSNTGDAAAGLPLIHLLLVFSQNYFTYYLKVMHYLKQKHCQ